MKLFLLFVFVSANICSQVHDSLNIYSEKIYNSNKDTSCYISIEYPQIKGLEDEKSLAIINDYLYLSFTKESADYNLSECDSVIQFIFEQDFSIQLNTRKFLSIRQLYYSYSGGAHGYKGSLSINIDVGSNEIILFSDIFSKVHYNDLAGLVEEKIKQDYKVESLKDAAFFEKGITIRDDQKFFVTPSSIIFHFNPYEIAPYSEGEIDVELKFDKIIDYINPEVPFNFLITND